MQQDKKDIRRRTVKVRGDYDFDGAFHPLAFREADGPTVRIDRICDVRPAASLRMGGQGTRYTCRVEERMLYLFHETRENKSHWFLDKQ